MLKLNVSRILGEYEAVSDQRRGYRNRQGPDQGDWSEDCNSWLKTCVWLVFKFDPRQWQRLYLQASWCKPFPSNQCPAVSKGSCSQGLGPHYTSQSCTLCVFALLAFAPSPLGFVIWSLGQSSLQAPLICTDPPYSPPMRHSTWGKSNRERPVVSLSPIHHHDK